MDFLNSKKRQILLVIFIWLYINILKLQNYINNIILVLSYVLYKVSKNQTLKYFLYVHYSITFSLMLFLELIFMFKEHNFYIS